MPALTVQNAEIKTATVEVKTLTISGKQVTLAVFRQLIESRLVEDDGTLNGVAWGTVNYHPDRCASARRHLHVVWQQGNQLLRSRVQEPAWWREEPFWSEGSETDRFVQEAFCLNGHRLPNWATYKRLPGHEEASVVFQLDGIECQADSPKGHWAGPAAQEPKCGGGSRDALRAVQTELTREVTEEMRRRSRITDAYRALQDLPQLFIAV